MATKARAKKQRTRTVTVTTIPGELVQVFQQALATLLVQFEGASAPVERELVEAMRACRTALNARLRFGGITQGNISEETQSKLALLSRLQAGIAAAATSTTTAPSEPPASGGSGGSTPPFQPGSPFFA
jgi:hypothetical protein